MADLTIAIDARLVAGTNTGDSTYWTGLMEGFTGCGGEFRLLFFSTGPAPTNFPGDPRFRWIELGAKSSRWWSAVAFPLAARRAGARVIHTQYSLSPLVGRSGVTTVHDVSFFLGPQWFSAKDRFLLQRTVPAACRRATKIIAVSETSAKEIVHWIPAATGKVAVTPNACPSWIQSLPVARAAALVQERFGIPGQYLLTVGTRWARKNMELAVASSARTPYDLIVTGKGTWRSGELGPRGRAVGYVSPEDLSALYSAATLYLAPSYHEGFGIPLLEAFRCGCPVICAPGGAMPEVAGKAAHITKGWTTEEWSQVIEELGSDSGKLNLMRHEGRERERSFDWLTTAQQTLEIYREVAA